MFNFLFFPALLFHNTITFGLTRWMTPKNTMSLSIIANSLVVSGGSYLFLNNYISQNSMMNIFQFTFGFFANEFLFKCFYDIKKDNKLKLIHHIVASIGIYKFYDHPKLISIIFFTEITNIPLEIRNICKFYDYNRFYVQYVMIGLLYTSFAYYRIYLITLLCIQEYKKKYVTPIEFSIFFVIYFLWIFWFYKINFVIYQKMKNHLEKKIIYFIRSQKITNT